VVVGDIDTEKSYRKLFNAFGIELDEYVIIRIFRDQNSRITSTTITKMII